VVLPVLRDKSFGVVATKGSFALAQRGAPTKANARVLKKLR
jgi:hypothetical protein